METNDLIKAILTVTAENLEGEYAELQPLLASVDCENYSKSQALEIFETAEDIQARLMQKDLEEALDGITDEAERYRRKGYVQAKYINGSEEYNRIRRALTNCNAVSRGEYSDGIQFLLDNLSFEDVTSGEYTEEFEELLLRDFRWTVDTSRIARKHAALTGTQEDAQTYRQKTAETKASIEAKVSEGKAVWRKYNGEWVIYGKNLAEGSNATVVKRSGETRTVGVGSIIKTDGEHVYATTCKAYE